MRPEKHSVTPYGPWLAGSWVEEQHRQGTSADGRCLGMQSRLGHYVDVHVCEEGRLKWWEGARW